CIESAYGHSDCPDAPWASPSMEVSLPRIARNDRPACDRAGIQLEVSACSRSKRELSSHRARAIRRQFHAGLALAPEFSVGGTWAWGDIPCIGRLAGGRVLAGRHP